MTWLAFIAEVIKALAWPSATLIIVLLLRKHLIALLPLLSKFKWKDFEFEFGKQIAEAQEVSAKLPPASPTAVASAAASPLFALAESSPRAAVLEAWIQVDRAARGAIIRHQIPQPVHDYVSTSKIIRVLQSEGLLAAEQAGLVQDLQGLRNQAAHAPDFALTREAARNYVDLSNRLTNHLDSV